MSKIKHILSNTAFSILTNQYTLENTFSNVYATDLVSMVIKHAHKEPILITQIDADATLAVAIMLNLPAIILTENKIFTDPLIEKANQENIAIITTSLTAVEVIKSLVGMKLI